MRHGTSRFLSFAAAKRYYAKQGFKSADVKAKLDAGEIHIGRPAREAGWSIGLDADERYWLIQENATIVPIGKP